MNKSFKLLISSLLAAACTCGSIAAQESYVVASPDGNIQLSVSAGEQLAVALLVDGEQLATTPVGLDIRQYGVVGSNPVINSVERNHVEGEIKVVIGENPSVYENYNEMTLNLGDYSLVCRAYDEGVAWRLVTRIDGDIIITDEVVDFTFAGNPAVWFSEAPESMSQWELSYEKYESAAAIPDGLFSVNPMMIKYEDTGLGLTIIESDIDDYPGMFLRSTADGHLHGKWAQYPNTIQNSSIYDSQAVLSRYDYIARTVGTREYPWRGIIVSRSDVELLNNDFIYKLAKPQKLAVGILLILYTEQEVLRADPMASLNIHAGLVRSNHSRLQNAVILPLRHSLEPNAVGPLMDASQIAHPVARAVLKIQAPAPQHLSGRIINAQTPAAVEEPHMAQPQHAHEYQGKMLLLLSGQRSHRDGPRDIRASLIIVAA